MPFRSPRGSRAGSDLALDDRAPLAPGAPARAEGAIAPRQGRPRGGELMKIANYSWSMVVLFFSAASLSAQVVDDRDLGRRTEGRGDSKCQDEGMAEAHERAGLGESHRDR